MDDPSRAFVGDLRGKARYTDLLDRLGEPQTPAEIELLVMVSRFLGDDEIATLTGILDRAIGDATVPHKELLARVAVLLGEADPIRDGADHVTGYSVAVSSSLARQLVQAVRP